jgi:hypothetical protein
MIKNWLSYFFLFSFLTANNKIVFELISDFKYILKLTISTKFITYVLSCIFFIFSQPTRNFEFEALHMPSFLLVLNFLII